MIIKIAWRNIWRNKVRSLVVITAIALGLWAGTFSSGFYEGVISQKINDVIESEISHFQIHDTLFRDEMMVEYFIPNAADIVADVEHNENVDAITGRVISMAMMASANKSGSAKVIGVDPQHENQVTGLEAKLVEGAYFEGIKRNPILISRKMADEYKLKVKSKVVLTNQDLEGEIVAASFRVVGIYKSSNAMFDEMNAFVRRQDLQNLLGMSSDQYHEIAVLLNEHDLAEPMATKYQEEYPDLEVLPWLDIAMGMRYMVEASGMFALVIVSIILIALLFSIVNTMLMAVMERTREIGMLMAIGFNRTKVFLMIMFETVFLSMVGAPIGLLIAFSLITYTGKVGIDLGAVGETYSELGFAAIVYPSLQFAMYMKITLLVLVMALIAAVYPALKALRLNPSEAIRKI